LEMKSDTPHPDKPVVVIYDADVAVARLIRYVVEDYGCNGVCVPSLAAAIAYCHVESPYALVCEAELDRVRTWLLPQLSSSPVRVVILCAGYDPALAADPADDYSIVPKPFACSQLASALGVPSVEREKATAS